jgi:hypothetical protein
MRKTIEAVNNGRIPLPIKMASKTTKNSKKNL